MGPWHSFIRNGGFARALELHGYSGVGKLDLYKQVSTAARNILLATQKYRANVLVKESYLTPKHQSDFKHAFDSKANQELPARRYVQAGVLAHAATQSERLR